MSSGPGLVLPRPASDGQGAGAVRVWLKPDAYAKRLLLGSPDADPWESAAHYLAYFTPSNGLLKPDVAVVDAGDLYDHWIRRAGGLATRLGKRRKPASALRALLEADEARALLSEAIGAVLSHLNSRQPVVLSMPSPRHWLMHANRLAGEADVAPGPDDVEDASMYIADLMRGVSSHAISGVLLEEQTDDTGFGEADVERYTSVINLARHYRWSLVTRAPLAASLPDGTLRDFDAVIGGTACPGGGPARGRDISAGFAAGTEASALEDDEFYFVQIDPAQQPEAVLARLARLRG